MARHYNHRIPDGTVLLRRAFQSGFLLLNLWIGTQFYLWVRYFERRGDAVYVPRPPGVEGWLPIASLMNLKYFVLTGLVPEVHPAGMFLLMAFLAISLVFRKAFCSWLCPIGTMSEWLYQGGRALTKKDLRAPKWLDVPLRSLKYILMGLFVWVVLRMSPTELRGFLDSPYGLVADVKMLDFFRVMGGVSLFVVSLLVILSVFTRHPWCRYLCPYGALMGIVALVSPLRITRDPVSCIDCGKCAVACPSFIPVDRLLTVKTAECSSCMTCLTVCPVQEALAMKAARRTQVSSYAYAAGITAIFVSCVALARVTGHWYSAVDERVFFDLIARVGEIGHPR
jgi:polyferredoxin